MADAAPDTTEIDLAQIAGVECPDVLAVLDAQFTARWVSPSVREAFGYQPEALIGLGVTEVVHMEDLGPVLNGIQSAGRIGGRHAAVECRLKAASGEFRLVRITSSTFTRDGDLWWVLCIRPVADDEAVVGRRSRLQSLASEAALTCSEMRSDQRATLVSIVESLAVVIGASGIAVWKVGSRESEICTSWTDDPRRTPPRPVVPIESLRASGYQIHEADDSMRGKGIVEAVEVALPSGRSSVGVLVAECDGPNGADLWDGHNIDLVAVIGGLVFAASQRADAEKLLLQRAETDELTGLLNSGAVKERMELMLRSAPAGTVCAVFGDLDGFKLLNDTLGHGTGDAVLVAVADALRSASGHDAVVGRIGGDEFVVVRDLTGPAEGMRLMNRCRAAVRDQLAAFGEVDMSLGLALSDPEDTPIDLLHRADLDMYTEKRRRAGWRADDGVPSWDLSDARRAPLDRRESDRRNSDRRSDTDRRAHDDRRGHPRQDQ